MKTGIQTCETINSRAAAHVKATCEGTDAGAAMARLANALQTENRRRRHRGDLPIAYEIQAKSGSTSISS